MWTPGGHAGVKSLSKPTNILQLPIVMGKNGHRTTTVLFFYMFPYYEGLQLKICIFLLTLKLPKSCPLNKCYQHDAPLGPFVFKEHPELLKSFLHPIPLESSSRGPSEGLQAGFLAVRFRRHVVPVWYLYFTHRVQTVQNVSKIKTTQNCWM